MTNDGTTTRDTPQLYRAAALQIAVAALEQANALEGVRPLQAGAFRAIAATARGIVAQADLQLAEIAGEGQGNG